MRIDTAKFVALESAWSIIAQMLFPDTVCECEEV
jgi:hypothetical protein